MKKAIDNSVSSQQEDLEHEKVLKKENNLLTAKQRGSKPTLNTSSEKLPPAINKPLQVTSISNSKGSTTAADAAASWIQTAREEAASTSSSETTSVSHYDGVVCSFFLYFI